MCRIVIARALEVTLRNIPMSAPALKNLGRSDISTAAPIASSKRISSMAALRSSMNCRS